MYLLMTRGQKLKIFPFDEPDEIQAIVDKKLKKLDQYGKWSPEMKELVGDLIKVDPRKRLRASEALNS